MSISRVSFCLALLAFHHLTSTLSATSPALQTTESSLHQLSLLQSVTLRQSPTDRRVRARSGSPLVMTPLMLPRRFPWCRRHIRPSLCLRCSSHDAALQRTWFKVQAHGSKLHGCPFSSWLKLTHPLQTLDRSIGLLCCIRLLRRLAQGAKHFVVAWYVRLRVSHSNRCAAVLWGFDMPQSPDCPSRPDDLRHMILLLTLRADHVRRAGTTPSYITQGKLGHTVQQTKAPTYFATPCLQSHGRAPTLKLRK